MKERDKTLSALLLTAIYCFAIGFVPISLVQYDNLGSYNAEDQECSSIVTTNLYCHISQIESIVNSANNAAVRGLKIHFNGLLGINKTTEQLFQSQFSQYTNFSRNFLTHFRKEDSIFPFHYFW